MIIQFTLQSTTDGSFMTGQASNTTVYISKDGGAFAATTNAVSEIGRGLYKVELTAAESAFTTLVYNPVCTGAQNNLYSVDAPTDVSGLATSSALADVATTANGIKAKTDNLPAVPAAKSDIPSDYAKAGDAMTLTAAYDAAKTASQLTAADIPSDYAKAGDAMTLTAAAVTAVQTGLALESDIASAEDTIIGNIVAAMPDVSGLATSSDLADVATTANGIKAKTDALPAVPAAKSDIPTAGDNATAVWNADDRSLTTEIEVEISADDISDIAAGVWNHTPRTLSGDPSSTVVYCNTAMLYAHWTQDKIDAWANGSQDAIDAAIVSASRKIDSDLDQAVSTPFQPVPADIRDLCILAAGVILARQAGDTDDPSVTAAESYYVKFVEDYNYTADN